MPIDSRRKRIAIGLLKDGLFYGVATVAGKGTPFLLMLLYANILPADQFGLMGLLMASATLLTTYVGMRPEVYIIKHRTRDAPDIAGRVAATFTLLLLSIPVVLAALFALGDLLPVDDSDRSPFLLLIIGLCGARGVQMISDSLLMADRRSMAYAASQLALSVSFFALALPVAYITGSWDRVGVANVGAHTIGAAIATGLAIRLVGREIATPRLIADRRQLTEAFAFLFPLTFHLVGHASVGTLDRMFIMNAVGAEAVGAYTAAATLALALGIIHEAALRAWNPWFFREVGDDHSKLRAMLTPQLFVATGSLALSVAYGYAAARAFPYLFPEQYWYAADATLVLSTALGFESARKVFCGALFIKARTRLLATVSIIGASINVVGNLYLTEALGIFGAAYSALGAFIFMAVAVGAIAYSISMSVTAKPATPLNQARPPDL